MDNAIVFSRAISLIKGGFCQNMKARSASEKHITAYHSEACFFSLSGAIIKSVYENYLSNGGEFYDFKVHRNEVLEACYTVLKRMNIILTRDIILRDHANEVPYPGRYIEKHTSINVLDNFLGGMYLQDKFEALDVVLSDFNDNKNTNAKAVISVLYEAYNILTGKPLVNQEF